MYVRMCVCSIYMYVCSIYMYIYIHIYMYIYIDCGVWCCLQSLNSAPTISHCNLIFSFTSLEITSFSPHHFASLFLSLSVFLVRIQVNFFRRHINHVGTGVCRMNSLRPGRVERMSTEIH